MARPYMDRVIPPLVANICRVCGVLPLSRGCDSQGLPVFSISLFFYSLSLALVTLVIHIAKIVFAHRTARVAKILDLFMIGIQNLLIILASTIQCKRGLTKSIFRNLKNVDEQMKYIQPTSYKVIYLLVFLYTFKVLLLAPLTDSVIDALSILALNVVNLPNEIILCCVIEAIGTRYKILHEYLVKACKPGMVYSSERDFRIALGEDLPIQLIKNMHHLLGETIFLVNNNFGLQFLGVFQLPLAHVISENVLKVLTAFNISDDVLLPKFYSTEIKIMLVKSINVTVFAILIWICSNSTHQAKTMFEVLKTVKKLSIDPVTRKQLNTAERQLPYFCTEFSAAGFFTLLMTTVFTTFALPLTSFLMNALQDK